MHKFLVVVLTSLFCLASSVTFGQGATSAEVDSYRIVCPAGQICNVSVRMPAAERMMARIQAPEFGGNPGWFDWSLALTGGGYKIQDGPSSEFVGGEFIAFLRFAENSNWWLQASLGPGYSHFAGKGGVLLSEFFGVQYRFASWFATGLGARHRVHLGDELHSVSPELQLQFTPASWFQFALSGGAGWSRYAVQELVSAGSTQTQPVYQSGTEDALIGGASLELRLLF